MLQQINLYQPVFRKQHKVFSAITLAQISAAVLLLLLVLLGHARWTLAGMQNSAQALEEQHAHLSKQITDLENLTRTPDGEALDDEISQLAASIEQRKFLLVQFDQLVIRNRNGFASQFKLLAEKSRPGLWLEGVTINSQGQIEIRGTTLDPRLLPEYLQQLGDRKELSRSAFEAVSMQRSEQHKAKIHFVLRNFEGDRKWQ